MEWLPDFNFLAVLTAILVGVAKTGVSGMGILVVPLIAMVFPAKESVGALLPMLIAGDVLAVIYYRRHAQWRQLVTLIPGVAAGMLIGGMFLTKLDNESMRIFLGVFVFLLLMIEGIARHLKLNEFKKLRAFAVLVGVLAGFGTTVGNAAGPIMGIYFIMMGFDKKQLMGSGAWFFLIVNTSKVPIFIYHEMMGVDTLQFFAGSICTGECWYENHQEKEKLRHGYQEESHALSAERNQKAIVTMFNSIST